MRVLLTGAFGGVGTTVRERLDHEFTYLDREAPADPDAPTTVADIADYEAIRPAFDGQDAVVHLAAIPGEAPWPDILETNIVGTYNVVEAARDAGVEAVVFASSNSVVGAHEAEHAPALYERGYPVVLDADSAVRPSSRYGTAKAFGEHLGRYYVERRRAPEQFYAVRIGSHRVDPYDHPYGDAERGVAAGEFERGSPEYRRQVARLKTTWHSQRDLAHMVECCLQDDSVGFGVFYGVSDNRDRWMDIEAARARVGYDPADDGGEWDGPPDDGTPAE
ncbi:MAG: NAD-dependent epimerase/dehydratase family protein [Halobacteriaceae archaeon]